MTPFEKQQIRTLVWKEWRQVRAVIGMAGGIFVLSLFMPLWSHMTIQQTFSLGTGMSFLMLSFGLGVVSYGMELNDHTNAYLITRPVEHWKVFMVKLLWSLVPVWIMAFLNAIDCISWRVLFAPAALLSVQFFILLIPPMVPALILSVSAGLLAVWYMKIVPMPLLLVLCCLFLAGSYKLAGRRMRGPGW